MAARVWTCRKCNVKNPRVKQRCEGCGSKRPPARRPKHQMVLEVPYEQWVERYGERCGICGRPPGPNRRLDRDHDHRGEGRPRGLLCHRCNRGLRTGVDVEWLKRAIFYLDPGQCRCVFEAGDSPVCLVHS